MWHRKACTFRPEEVLPFLGSVIGRRSPTAGLPFCLRLLDQALVPRNGHSSHKLDPSALDPVENWYFPAMFKDAEQGFWFERAVLEL